MFRLPSLLYAVTILGIAPLLLADEQGSKDSGSTSPPISISGVYPSLVMWNSEGECGTGAVVPWQGSLWAITYAPHKPAGSTDKLYEITPDLKKHIYAKSVGGTPANRMIHTESQQLLIGPYLINKNKDIRIIPPSKMFGRLTANARHLTDPENKIYYATMEEGLYEVDVNTLDVTCLIRDGNGGAPKAGIVSKLPGYHGKGMFSSQGRVVYANNGERDSRVKTDPTIPSGALAQWSEDGDWQLVRRNQFTEVTGPGGIYGNKNPEKDPIWAMGWDAKSLILALLENKQWHYYRLPKGSHSYDGSHGWNTEWPRIREIGEEDLLATMHGTFWRFPATFSKANSAGIVPRSNYLKVIGDFCRWGDRIVLGCDDSAKAEFLNKRSFKAAHGAPLQSNSNLWFIEPERLDQLGTAIGRGSVWLREDIEAGKPSEPYLFSGYDHRQLHLTHSSDHQVDIVAEVDQDGTGDWKYLHAFKLPPKGSISYIFPESENGCWIRLTSKNKATSITAHFQYRNDDGRNENNASLFSGIATIEQDSTNFGLMRSLAHDKLGLVASTTSDESDLKYYELSPSMQLHPVDAPDKAAKLVSDTSQPASAYTVDDASVLIIEDGKRYRLPKNDLYSDSGSIPKENTKTLEQHLKENLAVGATVRSSSIHAEYDANKAVDGIYSDESRWVSKQKQEETWIEFDLGEPKAFSSICIITGWDKQLGTAAADFEVQMKAGGYWVPIPGCAIKDNDQFEKQITLKEPVTTQNLRLFSKSQDYFRLYEFALFKEPIKLASKTDSFSRARVCREVATERDLLNIHGTFYELPARNAQGLAKVRPISTHNLAIHDFCSHNGLLLFTGLKPDAEGEHIFRSDDGIAAVWAGVVDDLWKLGKPRGKGGPWKDSKVTAGVPSDPYLMTAYDKKSVTLQSQSDCKITLEVDIDGTGLWIPYKDFDVKVDTPVEHEFPEGFSAYWVRATSDRDTTASVIFDYN